MMGMVYQWKPESRIKIDAQKAGEEMERIRVRNNGRLDIHALVKAAKAKASPFHEHFDWDDKIAADKHRLQQASHLIVCIEVMIEEQPESKPIRAFVSVVRDADRSYTSINHAMSDDELRQQVIRQAWSELAAWKARHAELVEFARVFSVIEEVKVA